jgi:hypothetical protein
MDAVNIEEENGIFYTRKFHKYRVYWKVLRAGSNEVYHPEFGPGITYLEEGHFKLGELTKFGIRKCSKPKKGSCGGKRAWAEVYLTSLTNYKGHIYCKLPLINITLRLHTTEKMWINIKSFK